MLRRIAELRGHTVICAYGRVGRAVASELESEGEVFVVIDPGEQVVERMEDDGIFHLVADPANANVLSLAGVPNARSLVTAVDSDSTNVFITMAARALNPDLFIVARASESDSAQHLYRAGADRVISPYISSGRHMALLALHPRIVDYLDIAGLGERSIRIEELRIEADSAFVGRSVGDASEGSMPLLLRRRNCSLIPSPSTSDLLGEGDVLVLAREQGAT